MGKFGDLTPGQRHILRRLVCFSRTGTSEQVMLDHQDGRAGVTLMTQGGAGT